MGRVYPALFFIRGDIMIVEEIFNKIISHMEEGLCYHKEFAKAFDFLGLWGFSKCQLYHQ
jgi:hypothetical protein